MKYRIVKFLGWLVAFAVCILASLGPAYAQSLTVSGTVTDEDGEPLIGAGVLIKGTNEVCVTDIDGRFSIDVEKETILSVSSIGFETKEVKVESDAPLKIVLLKENTILDEVIVVGYGTLTKKEMTSAISHIGSDDLNNISSIDAAMLIQGKAPGVSVSNTAVADPNSYGSIQIRGVSSRSAGLGPLIVIDGIPGGDLTTVNPADIESFDILKDGAASAIYGTRGSNGVILINLKKSRKDGQIHTQYNGSLTLNVPKNELDIMNADQFRAYRVVLNPLLDLGADTDWFKESTKLGVTHMHTLTLSGGNVKTNYRVTADFRDAEGIDLRSERMEYGARANINHTNKSGLFSFTVNLAPRIIKRSRSAGNFGAVLKNNPTMPVYDASNENGYYHVPAGGENSNIVETMNEVTDDWDIKLFSWDASAKLNILPLFTPKNQNLALDTQVTVSQYHVDKFSGTYSPSDYGPNINSAITGSASREYSNSVTTNLDWVTNFSGKFGDHQLRVMLGYSWFYGMNQSLSASNQNFTSDATTYNDLGSGEWASLEGKINMDSSKSDHKLISFFGRVSYDWKQRYLFTASLRYEGSSRFGYNNKWGFFPAVSVGWRISDEPWMKGSSEWLDELKIRYDYGVTGNQDFGNYQSLSTYRSFGYYQYNGKLFRVWGPSKNVNPTLRWERGHNQNIGLDFSLFDYRLSGSFNYFIRRQSDLLGDYNVSIPPNLFSTIYANVGTLRNNGFEFDITVDVVRNEKFDYQISLVGATNDNRFMKFSNDVYDGQSWFDTCSMSNPNNPGYLQRIQEGERIGNYFTYRYAGVDKDGDWLIYDRNGNVIPVAQGEQEDKTVTGNGLPKFTGSMTHKLRIGNFDFNLSLRTALGFQIFNVHDFYFGLQSMTTNVLTSAYAKNAHITKGKNVITDYFIENGDYLKIDNLTVGYTFKFNRKFIESIRLYATGSNLYTFTAFTGVDPSTYEVNGLTPGTMGGSYNYYPSAFQFILGLQIGF